MNRNPYAAYVEGRDLLHVLEETPGRIDAMVRHWPRVLDERSHAPGKWTARQILVHLAQSEMLFSTRLRFALAENDYTVKPFDQDDWMMVEPTIPALAALDAYVALRRMNLALCHALRPAHRAKRVVHPEHGEITVDWIIAFFAGHERNHLLQIEAIGAR